MQADWEILSLQKLVVVKSAHIGYNDINLKCSILLLILNLHYFKRDSYIAKWLSGPHPKGSLQGKAKVWLRLPT